MSDSFAERDQSPGYQPSPEQLNRALRLRRYNGLTIYMPLAIVGIALIALGIYVVFLTAGEADLQTTAARRFVSAAADLVIIFAALSGTVLCLLFPAAGIAYGVWVGQRERSLTQSLQFGLWRLEGLLDQFKNRVDENAPRLANPVIHLLGRGTFLQSIWLFLKGLLQKPDERGTDATQSEVTKND